MDGSGAITSLLACTEGNKEEEVEVKTEVVVAMRPTGFDIDFCWALGAGASPGGIFLHFFSKGTSSS